MQHDPRYPWEEPGAGNPHARICEGESRMAELLDQFLDGPRKGQREIVIPDLPGYPDNINRASDGNFLVALVGMRSPVLDLALRMPSFRKRIAKRVAKDEWLFPNIN